MMLACELSSSPDMLQVLLVRFVSMAWSMALESMPLHPPDLWLIVDFLTTLRKFLEPPGYCTVINWAFIFFQMFFGCFCGVMAQFELVSMNSWIRSCRMSFKSHTEWSRAQCISTPTTTTSILTAWTILVMWYMHYELTHPKILQRLWLILILTFRRKKNEQIE